MRYNLRWVYESDFNQDEYDEESYIEISADDFPLLIPGDRIEDIDEWEALDEEEQIAYLLEQISEESYEELAEEIKSKYSRAINELTIVIPDDFIEHLGYRFDNERFHTMIIEKVSEILEYNYDNESNDNESNDNDNESNEEKSAGILIPSFSANSNSNSNSNSNNEDDDIDSSTILLPRDRDAPRFSSMYIEGLLKASERIHRIAPERTRFVSNPASSSENIYMRTMTQEIQERKLLGRKLMEEDRDAFFETVKHSTVLYRPK
jgi:hypothetical protein